jgi:protein-tyrosine phosphatase
MKTLELTVSRGQGLMVHSHKGVRRPAIVIGCWLVYSGKLKADKAIEFYAEKRLKGQWKRKLKKEAIFVSAFEQGGFY